MEKDVIGSYLNSIKQYPLLTAEQEKELSMKIQKGDKKALNDLINSNLRLVISVARKIQTNSTNIMDLIQEGNMGLMVAAEKFHFSFKTRFSTYAYPWIAQYMLRYANNRSSLISLPHRKDNLIRKIQNAQSYLYQQNRKEATITELALYTGIEEEKVAECLSYSYTISSLDVDTNDEGNSITVGDLVADYTYCPENQLIKDDTCREIRSLMSSLPGNEQKVLWYRYNFDGEMHPKTLREISKIIGVSPEAVRQTEIRAVKHLKSVAEAV